MSESLGRFGESELIVLTRGELEAFADRVVTKVREVAAAMKAAQFGVASGVISTGSLTVDVEGYEACMEGCRIFLKPREFKLLAVLAQNAGRVLTRQQLLELAWPNIDSVEDERTVDVHVRRVRVKLGQPNLIETVSGVGYRLLKLPPSPPEIR
jgi:two-component system phosphate regulon response regulator PhoB